MPNRSSSPASIEWLPVTQIQRRLLQIDAESSHLASKLPKASPHNAILRIADIARYIGINLATLRPQMRGAMGCARQIELSRFFKAWDSGILVKAVLDGKWQIVNRHTHGSVSPLAAAPRPPLTMKIIDTPAGPRLRGA